MTQFSSQVISAEEVGLKATSEDHNTPGQKTVVLKMAKMVINSMIVL